MGIEFVYNEVDHCVNARISGHLDMSEVISYFEDILGREDISDFHEVVDFSHVDDFTVTYSDLMKVSELSSAWQDKGHRFTLFLAPSGVPQDITGMLHALFSRVPFFIHICNTPADVDVIKKKLLNR